MQIKSDICMEKLIFIWLFNEYAQFNNSLILSYKDNIVFSFFFFFIDSHHILAVTLNQSKEEVNDFHQLTIWQCQYKSLFL